MNVVYRYYDAEGRVLYIGCTANFANRDRQHVSSSSWRKDAVRYVVSKPYRDRDQALHEEREAVRYENPIHNICRFVTCPTGPWTDVSPEVEAFIAARRRSA